MFLLGEMKVHVPLGSLIDKQSELHRLQKEMEKLRKELDKSQNKLTGANFRDRAPAAVVEQEKQRVREFEAALIASSAQARQDLEKLFEEDARNDPSARAPESG